MKYTPDILVIDHESGTGVTFTACMRCGAAVISVSGEHGTIFQDLHDRWHEREEAGRIM